MDDRELLELAAKAAGYEIKPHQNAKVLRSLMFLLSGNPWNPLTDDGDALRLAVKLRLPISFHTADNAPVCVWCEPIGDWLGELGVDRHAATRRAIVRAAAEIGRTK